MLGTDLTFLATSRSPHCTIRIDKRLDGYYTIQFMERGGVQLGYDDRWTRMEGAWFWPAYPGPLLRFHAAEGHTGWFHRHIGFRGPRVQEWIAANLWPWDAQPAPPGTDWPEFIDTLIQEVNQGDRWSHLRAINRMERLLIDLTAARTPSHSPPEWLEPLLERLRTPEDFTPNYPTLATELGMGESTLRRRFREATGISLHTYVLQARIARAQTLLRETDLSLPLIAERLGYDNVYFFARQFKEKVGMPPGAFRKAGQF